MGNGTTLNLSDSANPSAAPAMNSLSAGSGPNYLPGAMVANGSWWADYGTGPNYRPSSPITVSAWVQLNSSQISRSICVNWWEPGGEPRNGFFLGISDNAVNQFKFGTGYSGDDTYNETTGATTLNVGQWYLVHGVYDSSAGTERLIVNGSEDGSNPWSKPISYASDNRLVVGALHYAGGYVQGFDGSISEVRVSTTARSDDWAATEYNNQSSAGTFFYTSPTEYAGTTPQPYPIVQPPTTMSYVRQVTIDHRQVANSDQTDFPVLISGTFSYLATVANGGRVQNANGYDIEFTSDAAGQLRLDHEIDNYSPVTGAASFWVRIPTLSHSTDTTIYMWYGNSSVFVFTREQVRGMEERLCVRIPPFRWYGTQCGRFTKCQQWY